MTKYTIYKHQIIFGSILSAFFLLLFAGGVFDYGHWRGKHDMVWQIAKQCDDRNEFKIETDKSIYMFSCNLQKTYDFKPWDNEILDWGNIDGK